MTRRRRSARVRQRRWKLRCGTDSTHPRFGGSDAARSREGPHVSRHSDRARGREVLPLEEERMGSDALDASRLRGATRSARTRPRRSRARRLRAARRHRTATGVLGTTLGGPLPTHPEEDPLHPTRLLRLGGPRGQAPRRSDDTDPCAAPARYERRTIDAEIVAKIITAQPNPRDRIALMLLFRLALRKSELAAIQFKHFGHDRKRLRVYGKGGTIIPVPVPDFIRQEIAAFMALERPKPSDYLLYPQKRTGHSGRWNREVEGVIWEDARSRSRRRRCIVGGIAASPTRESSSGG